MGSNRFAADIPAPVKHLRAGRLDLDVMVSTESPLDALPAALEDFEAGDVLGRAVIVL